jgi:hypothetical protein
MKKRDVRLTTEAHRPAFEVFYDAMRGEESREGWRPSEVLQRFLDAGFRAVRGALLRGSPDFDANEAEYMAVVKHCRHPTETMNDLSRMLGSLGLALMTEPVDFVGPVFTVLSADSWMGQVFTPHHVSYFMAKMIVGNATAELNEGKKYITLCEPCCGVGGMVLAANVALREQGFDVARQVHWHMTDIDYRAICGAYLQTALTDCSAVVVHGDSLSNEVRLVSPTPAAVMFPKSFGARVDVPVAAPKGQLSLFG